MINKSWKGTAQLRASGAMSFWRKTDGTCPPADQRGFAGVCLRAGRLSHRYLLCAGPVQITSAMGNARSRKRDQLSALSEIPDYKILFLGTGNSGKSTLYKQMIHLCDPNREMGISSPTLARHFIATCVTSLMEARKKYLTESSSTDNDVSWLEKPGANERLAAFWLEEATQRAFSDKYQNHINENAEYFLSSHAQRILSPDVRITKLFVSDDALI
jgi:hypothetical protein